MEKFSHKYSFLELLLDEVITGEKFQSGEKTKKRMNE